MMKRIMMVLLFTAVSVSICTAQAQLRNFHQEGQASQDIETDELEVNHPSLPIGSQVRVTNPKNGKQVVATITGRIPISENRIVDLSQGTAQSLGLPTDGRSPIILESFAPPRISEEEEPEEPPEDPPEEEPEPEEPAREPPPREESPPEEPVEPPTEEPPPEPQVTVLGNSSANTTSSSNSSTDTSTDSNNDSRTQTAAPVSAQSPNITIYNTIMSPNSFATDSAPVNATSGGAQPAVNAGTPSGADGTGAPGGGIIALAPSSSVSTTKQEVTPPPSEPTPREPAVASASASIVATQPQSPDIKVETPEAPSSRMENVAAPPVAPIQPPPQAAPPVAPVAPPPVAAPPQPQPQQPLSPPQPSEPSPPSAPVDVGTALIMPYMPNPDNGKIYRVQVGAFKNTWNAKEAFDHLTLVGFKPAFERYGDWIRVVISGIRAADMPAVARLIGKVGFKEALIREEN